ncbi:protein phosphatase 2C domain-containing protein [Streptomyces sp. TP-A0874]|uniref:protein phosphatase 2C domain-containing protein n=1 Tax=Streptomyces sp. TP-A0874 TaxID=549819 RepID=UPI0008534A83|nr:protein phosphatase 2C domain-containing protein [Streptomyces sp. TP-A0874]
MRVELTTEPGDPAQPNEDYVSVALPASGRGGVLVLLDGVTPPAGDDGCRHGVPWFTTALGGAMLESSASRRHRTLADSLTEAIDRTAAAHRTTCDLSHPRTPQATAVAARWDEERLEYLVLSDSALLLQRPDGAVTAVLDDRLDRLPAEVRAAGEAARALPRGSEARAAATAEYTQAVEALRNAEGGFFTAAADPSVAERAVTGWVRRDRVRAAAALTDGASRYVEVFGAGDWADCFALLLREGPAGLVGRVRTAERADADRTDFPRGKAQDDASAALIEF